MAVNSNFPSASCTVSLLRDLLSLSNLFCFLSFCSPRVLFYGIFLLSLEEIKRPHLSLPTLPSSVSGHRTSSLLVFYETMALDSRSYLPPALRLFFSCAAPDPVRVRLGEEETEARLPIPPSSFRATNIRQLNADGLRREPDGDRSPAPFR